MTYSSGREPAPCLLNRLAAVLLGLCLPGAASSAVPLLPDLFSWEDEGRGYMHGGTFDVVSEPGHVLYRFSTAIPNQGDGTFEVFEVTHPNQTQDVYQNIYDSEGGMTQVLMASFTDIEEPPFGHLHLEGLAQYSLREVTNANGVGPIVATHFKTSHALVDSVGYDLSLPGAPTRRVYDNPNANPLGVSIGWADWYPKSIPKQRIDVTGVPSGQYWLEVVVDPFDYVQETDETNNTTRILVDLTIPDPVFLAADFDQDTDVDGFDRQTWELNFGSTTAAHVQGDADDDQDVDGDDLLTWQRQFTGELNAAWSVSTAVPEPGNLILLLGLSTVGLRGRTRAQEALVAGV